MCNIPSRFMPLVCFVLVTCCVMAAFGVCASLVRADDLDVEWVGYQNGVMVSPPDIGSFNHGDNWFGYVVPGEGDHARFGSGKDGNRVGFPHVVHFGDFCVDVFAMPNPNMVPAEDVVLYSFDIQNESFTFDFGTGSTPGGNCATPLVDSGSLTVTDSVTIGTITSETDVVGNAALLIRGGSLTSRALFIAGNPGTTGVVTVDGAGSTWTVGSNSLLVGTWGNGTLNVTHGGAVRSVGGYLGFYSGSRGTVTVNGAGSQWISSDTLYVGVHTDGTLNITGGGAVRNSSGSTVGRFPNATGGVTVDGAGSTWTNSSYLSVGSEGSGTLNVTDGGTVSSDFGLVGSALGSTGEVTVDGAGSTWTNSSYLSVGDEGSGTLNVTDGGAVSNEKGYIGRFPGSTGEVTVDGIGSQWNNADSLLIGEQGVGTLTIQNGGTVDNTWGSVGQWAGSTGTVTVDGVGSQWNSDAFLFIGEDGDGTLTIQNGGTVTTATPSGVWPAPAIGVGADSTGTATVDGVGSKWDNSGDLYVGFRGTGDLMVRNGGAVINSGMLEVGSEGTGTLTIQSGGTVDNTWGSVGQWAGSTGTVTVDGVGSQWNNRNPLAIGGESVGTLIIQDGGTVTSTSTDGPFAAAIGDRAGSTGTATVDGAGSKWDNRGDLYVGNAGTGTLRIQNGGLVQVNGSVWVDEYETSDGTLAFGIGTDGSGLLDITDSLVIGETSTLSIALVEGFTPTLGEEYELVAAAWISGEFTTESLPALPGDLFWDLSYRATGLTLDVITALAGDADKDGVVGFGDYLILEAAFGGSGQWKDGDFDASGNVDFGDYLILEAAFGDSLAAQSATTAIPEPGTLAMLFGAMAAMGWWRRRK